MNKITQPDKDEIYDYYVVQSHDQIDSAVHFGVSRSTFQRWCRGFGFVKDDAAVAAQRRLTNIERYGYANPLLNEEVKTKSAHTCKIKYGVDNVFASPVIKEKIKATNTDRYGYACSSQNSLVKNKRLRTLQKKYGVSYGCQVHLDPNIVDILNSKRKLSQYVSDNYTEKPSMTAVALKLGVAESTIFHLVAKYHLANLFSSYNSTEEDDFASWLSSNDVVFERHNRSILSNHQEIDFWFPEVSVGIEFNGVYWHSTQKKDKNYHYNKSKMAESKGIRLIHVYEYEWNDPLKRTILKSMLLIALGKCSHKIFARQCEIREISNQQARDFNNYNHLQGHRNAQLTYGLYYHNELVQLMSFSKTKYNRNLSGPNDWEIIRGCPGSNNLVIGGLSKLFAHFVNEKDPSSVFSYCDFNKFDGHGYEQLGMRFIGYTGPDLKYVIDGKVVNRNPKHYKNNQNKAELRIYGAGSKKYLYIKDGNGGKLPLKV